MNSEVDPVTYRIDPALTNAALNELFQRAWPEHAPRLFGPVLARSLVSVAAFAGEQLIGFVNVATDGGAHAFLLDPTVDPDYRRRGIGRTLVQTAIEVVRSGTCEWLHVDYEPQLEPFYAATGFRATAAGVLHLDRTA
jgi:ribosomal protein S18 acetylase RimI-like enzyme